MRCISSNGHAFKASKRDSRLIKSRAWCVHLVKGGKYRYVVHCVRKNGRTKMLFLHRLIKRATKGQMVDHLNGDTLDNSRSNLRICSNRLNQGNQRRVRGVVKYKGVTIEGGKFRARIREFGRKKCLGTFSTPEEAATAYLKAAKVTFGKYAYSNLQ